MKAIGIVATAVLATLLNGWVLARLWLWFIATTFHAVPLMIPQAIGVSIVLGAMHPQTSSDTDEKRPLAASLALAIARPLLALAVGYVVHLFL